MVPNGVLERNTSNITFTTACT